MQNVYAIDLSKDGEVRGVLATVPQEHGSQDPQQGLWRFNDSRAAPGGQIIAGRYTLMDVSQRSQWNAYTAK